MFKLEWLLIAPQGVIEKTGKYVFIRKDTFSIEDEKEDWIEIRNFKKMKTDEIGYILKEPNIFRLRDEDNFLTNVYVQVNFFQKLYLYFFNFNYKKIFYIFKKILTFIFNK